jgi:hypothetical protein
MWVDGVLVNEIDNVDTSTCGDANKLRVGINDAWKVQGPLIVYGDCMSFGGNYIERSCHPDAKNYFIFNLKSKEMSTDTEFPLSEYQEEPETSVISPPTFSCTGVMCLKFDEGSGNIAYDSSSNHNDGDIYASFRNLVKNPSFEMDKQDWGSGDGTWDIVTDEKYHGSKSSRFQDLTGVSGHESAGPIDIPVTPGQSITVSLYSKGSNIVAGSQPSWYKADLVGRWYDSSLHVIGVYPPYPDLVVGEGTGTWDWERKSMTTTAQAGAAYYHFYFGLLGDSKGTLWVDAVQVEYGSTLTAFTDSIWTSGKFNYGLEFDGVSDYVDCGNDNSLSITKEMTVDFWIKINSYTPSGSWPNIVGKGNENSNGWRIYQEQNSKKLVFAYNDGTTGHFILHTGDELQLNEWYHIAVTFSLSQGIAKIYINGVQYKDSNDIYEIKGNTDSLFIGGGVFNGAIDEVRIYNRALSQAEIQADMNSG